MSKSLSGFSAGAIPGFALVGVTLLLAGCTPDEAGQEVAREESRQAPVYYHSPKWSPDGARIAFYSNRDGNFEIYTIGPDGSDLQRLTNNEEGDSELSWSPGGGRIAFNSNRGGTSALWMMNADGTDPVRIWTDGGGGNPAWSPDGTRIAFERRVEGNRDIVVIDADGSNLTRLTSHEGNDFSPSWSPDGDQIVFSSNRGGTYGLYIMKADGSTPGRLADAETHEVRPNWSPDGKSVLFVRIEVVAGAERAQGLFLVDLDGRREAQITSDPALEPCWSPDGRRIAFVANESEGMGLYVMNSDGSGKRRLLPPP